MVKPGRGSSLPVKQRGESRRGGYLRSFPPPHHRVSIKGCATNINKQNVLAAHRTYGDAFRGLTLWQHFKREIQVSGATKAFMVKPM